MELSRNASLESRDSPTAVRIRQSIASMAYPVVPKDCRGATWLERGGVPDFGVCCEYMRVSEVRSHGGHEFVGGGFMGPVNIGFSETKDVDVVCCGI